jgi:ABC-type uncharacterized transport system fused permease/ATPase subunit
LETTFCRYSKINIYLFSTKHVLLVLDEATSAMDKETGEHLYSTLMTMGTTVVSVTHHHNIIHMHNIVVRLDGQGGYTVEEEGKSSSLVAV